MTADPLLIMVAPNGARRTRADHPALPVTATELADTAAACLAAGAGAMHVHVRDETGAHVLDASRYADAIAAIRDRTDGKMLVQITTEAVGRYSPSEQMELVRVLRPAAVSVGLREILGGGEAAASAFFSWAAGEGIAIQHILYDRADLDTFAELHRRDCFGESAQPRMLFVLGRYAPDQESRPEDLDAFLDGLEHHRLDAVWSVCAFGRGETSALAAALARGGHVRVGFENSLWHADGRIARDNAERVAAIATIANIAGRPLTSADQARAILGVP
ncbi:MAG: 3-keto-5-aminohexanoate cleavage protein [Inquilinus limosus]|uniref:3-keto-5-aminohexanoate cleavage protein n=1 Tax=Inquilinus limosus TaxID=171674 RepID=A0A952FJY5_9PROT|nr:3-keto-5-aminohexanoate cleavage protein [Inquilinus limosus]